MESRSREHIWYKDPTNFITLQNYDKFFPNKAQSFAEQLNSSLRLTIYFCFIVFILKHDINIWFISIFMAILTYFMFNADNNTKINEQLYLADHNQTKDPNTGDICTKPTKENPFMNVLMTDYSDDPSRSKACDVSDKTTKKNTSKFFDDKLYRDVDDIWHRNASDRQFYTNPITTVGGDQSAFAQFLYGDNKTNKTCKEGSSDKCYQNLYRPYTLL
jgi:hypothetical protein